MNSDIVKNIVYGLEKKVISTATTTAVKNLLVHTTRIKGHATWGETTHEKEFYSFYY